MPFKFKDKIIDKHLLHYVPHGINSEEFKPLPDDHLSIRNRKKELFGEENYEFVVFYNSRNVQRKKTSNLILSFRAFCDNLTAEEAKKCALVLHTEKTQDAGTDLPAVIKALCPNYKVVFSDAKLPPAEMTALYNIASVTVLPSSNEGFGLSIAESIMCGTPVVVNVTGGLQDQIGQVEDDGTPVKFNKNFGTNSVGKFKKYGKWAKAVYPTARTIQGSIPTPYIFDDICTWEDTAEAIMYWYLFKKNNKEEYEKCGLEGRRWAMNEGGINSKNMCNQFIKAMDFTIENYVKPKAFKLYTVENYYEHAQPDHCIGLEIPKINIDKLKEEIHNTISSV
jgi:glycosyltransferase involved in cell wall biosynthesis